MNMNLIASAPLKKNVLVGFSVLTKHMKLYNTKRTFDETK